MIVEPAVSPMMERGSGVALWRQVADRIRQAIAEEAFAADGRLPPEIVLAGRFGVNRHTVRGAIASLVQEGVLRAEQGRGTFVEHAPRISYALGRRTRFSANLEGQAREARTYMIHHATVPAGQHVAAALDIAPGAPVVRLDIVGEADGRPITRAMHWFDAGRFPDMADAYAQTGSVTAAFARQGLGDYLRRSTTISARHAEADDLADLRLIPGAIVLVAVAINEDAGGRPVQFSETLFAADRIELSVS